MADELVLSAQQAALAAVHPGISCKGLDAVARAVIEAAGQGERFGHGLGHGVGLEVHEAPRLGTTAEGELRLGQVVTIALMGPDPEVGVLLDLVLSVVMAAILFTREVRTLSIRAGEAYTLNASRSVLVVRVGPVSE